MFDDDDDDDDVTLSPFDDVALCNSDDKLFPSFIHSFI